MASLVAGSARHTNAINRNAGLVFMFPPLEAKWLFRRGVETAPTGVGPEHLRGIDRQDARRRLAAGEEGHRAVGEADPDHAVLAGHVDVAGVEDEVIACAAQGGHGLE